VSTAAACIAGAFLFGLPSRAYDQVPGPEQTAAVLLRGGDLYTISGGVLARSDLLFDNGRITAIGRGIEPPPGAEIIDVTGRRVYPGFIAPQTTIGLIEIDLVRATNDLAEAGRVTPEAAAQIAFNPDSEIIPTVRSRGITTAQVVPRGELVRGSSFIAHLDGWTREQSTVKPNDGMQVSWAPVATGSGWWVEDRREKQMKTNAERRRELEQAFERARAYHEARLADPSEPEIVRWEAMRPLWSSGMPLFVEANDYRQIVDALDFAERFDLRLVIVGGKDAHLAAEVLAERDVPVIVGSTMSLPMRRDDAYDAAFKLPVQLERAGVRFCLGHFGSAAWDVRNLPFQAGQAVAFGLSPESALRALTLSTAEILGIDRELGSLEVGKQATLFVSEGDPLDMLEHRVSMMFIEGRRVDLDNRHEELYRKYRRRK
jgi:imidazolonepropionase-like amidohydrolase